MRYCSKNESQEAVAERGNNDRGRSSTTRHGQAEKPGPNSRPLHFRPPQPQDLYSSAPTKLVAKTVKDLSAEGFVLWGSTA